MSLLEPRCMVCGAPLDKGAPFKKDVRDSEVCSDKCYEIYMRNKDDDSDEIPFGPEWEKAMMKLKKSDIINMLKHAWQEKDALKSQIDEFIYGESHGETLHCPEER